ncbi:hypothetical protein RF11_04635 [Thelohanellus kitauei]|uniref:Uncharacterized protein n=1 Tax=Thelohanellus kitauei TaxID=669202 RepID=A0A0C2JY03_THEKT|nr:hypothetical protein RF11_04635 [Thelohanellus kitauei]
MKLPRYSKLVKMPNRIEVCDNILKHNETSHDKKETNFEVNISLNYNNNPNRARLQSCTSEIYGERLYVPTLKRHLIEGIHPLVLQILSEIRSGRVNETARSDLSPRAVMIYFILERTPDMD